MIIERWEDVRVCFVMVYCPVYQATEDKYTSQKHIEATLHTQILDLYHQMALLQTPPKPPAPRGASAGEVRGSGGGATGEGEGLHGSEDKSGQL